MFYDFVERNREQHLAETCVFKGIWTNPVLWTNRSKRLSSRKLWANINQPFKLEKRLERGAHLKFLVNCFTRFKTNYCLRKRLNWKLTGWDSAEDDDEDSTSHPARVLSHFEKALQRVVTNTTMQLFSSSTYLTPHTDRFFLLPCCHSRGKKNPKKSKKTRLSKPCVSWGEAQHS